MHRLVARKHRLQSARSADIRYGKWSEAEELYADRLINDFQNGNLSDCEAGKTLRVYLSSKLNCEKMRISKKFAGKCIGKVRDISIRN